MAVYVLDRSYETSESALSIILIVIASMLSESCIPFLALFVGFMYSRGVRGFRLKRGYGVKS